VVLMGEVHGHALGNAVQQEMFEDILTANPNALLAMEFYERDEQVALDDYLAGITDREAFEQAADRNEGNNPWAHARMIEASKEAGRPVIAANAPRRYVRLARTGGFDRLRELNEYQRALVEIPEQTPQGAYRDRFMEAMGGMASHGGEEMIESFLRSQSTWDATMAQSIVDAFEHGTPVVLVVGYFHAQFPFEPGSSELVDQLRKRTDRNLNIVTCITLPATHDEIQEDDRNIADFVVYVGEPGE
ncbi:MAG: ChaN family lipoprotein, partial [bacterium]|nr:ChaN family lipoprotein [bacterium]